MNFLFFLLILFWVFAKAAGNSKKNGKSSGRSASGSDERRVEEAKEASRRQTQYSYEHNDSGTIRKADASFGTGKRAGGAKAAAQTVPAKKPAVEEPLKEGTAQPGSLGGLRLDMQGMCPPDHHHGGTKNDPWNPDTEGSLKINRAKTPEGSCAPDHQHGGYMPLTHRLGPQVETPKAQNAAAAKTAQSGGGLRFSDNEIVNGMIWGEVLRRPAQRRTGRAR